MSLKSRCIGCLALAGLTAFSTAALADGMPSYGGIKDVPVAQPFTWSGLYIGAHAGYAWGTVTSTNINGNPPFPAGTGSTEEPEGWLWGLQAGYNWQFSPNLLIGVEADYTRPDMETSSSRFSSVAGFTANRLTNGNADTKWFATMTGRLGFVVNDWLVYVKGGAAWVSREQDSITVNPTLAPGNPGYVRGTASGGETITGWTVGGGLEWAFARNVSAKIEYNYMQFADTVSRSTTSNPLFPPGLNPLLRDVDLEFHAVKLGINYRFNTY